MAGPVDRRTDVLSLHTRLIRGAAKLTSEVGWSAVTMAKLADLVGVSRQTVYNEVGGKDALAEAMVLHELGLFLDRVDARFVGASDLNEAIRGAAYDVLELAQTDPLLRAVLSSSHGKSTDLLPLLTTESEALLETATSVIGGHIRKFELPIDADRLTACIDMVVRLVLSHVMAPNGTPEQTADDIAWMAARVLAG